jgi:hypothetical protein
MLTTNLWHWRAFVIRQCLSAILLLIFLWCAPLRSQAQIPTYGNLQAQEYGDAVYRELNVFWLTFFGADYNHTMVYAGINGSHVPKVMGATSEASSSGGDVTAEVDLSDMNNRVGLSYYGAYTKSNLTVSFTGRKSIVATAVSIVDAYIPYVALDAINFYSGGNSVGYISEIRCDAVVEYSYEANGYIVWWPSAYPGDWSILNYPADHNDAPTPPSDPSYEFSPWAQRGAPGGSFWGPSPGNTYMTRPSVINLPTYQLTQVTNAGYADVTIQATDESGIHYIGYKKPGDANWNYSPTQVQHPTSDTYSFGAVRITNSGTLYVFAVDNGGNYPTLATSFTITVPPPDTTRPTVSITNPPSAKTYTNAQIVTISANATDNVGVASVEFYDGSTLKGTDTAAAYTYDWSFTAADNGAHVWTARAYDAAGNVSTSSAVTLTVSIDITPPTVAISTPTNGQVLTTASFTVTGTATDPGLPTSGLSVVQVRQNGGSWSNATGTASWSRSVTLSPCSNTIEARSLDKAGNYSTNASISVTYTPPNTVPNTPSNVSPTNGETGVSLTPALQASAFNDPDCVGDTHAASQWQVLNSAGAVVVADSGTDMTNKVAWTVPANKLYYGTNYLWRVRYEDSRNGWSSYSTQTAFTTLGPLLGGSQQGTNMVFKWPTNALGFALQWSTNLGVLSWSNATPSPVIVNGQYTVTNNMTNQMRFYRLKK